MLVEIAGMKKTNVCPKCRKTVPYLIHRQSGWFELRMDKKGYTKRPTKHEPDGKYNAWSCPYCEQELFFNENDAFKFIGRGKK